MAPFVFVNRDEEVTFQNGQWEDPKYRVSRFIANLKTYALKTDIEVEFKATIQRFIQQPYHWLKLVGPKGTPFPTIEQSFRDLVARSLTINIKCSLSRSSECQSFFNKMLIGIGKMTEVATFYNWIKSLPAFEGFELYWIDQGITAPRDYNYYQTYFCFGFPKIAAEHLGLTQPQENFFVTIEMQREYYFLAIPGCLLGVSPIYLPRGMHSYNKQDRQFYGIAASEDLRSTLQVDQDINHVLGVVPSFRKKSSELTFDLQKKFTDLGHNFYVDIPKGAFADAPPSRKEEMKMEVRGLTCPMDKYHFYSFGTFTTFGHLEKDSYRGRQRVFGSQQSRGIHVRELPTVRRRNEEGAEEDVARYRALTQAKP